MELVTLLDKYIEKLDKASSLEQSEIEALIEDITRVFISKDELRELWLDYYNSYNDSDDLMSDVRKLKTKLEYNKAVLIDKNEKVKQRVKSEQEQRELEKLRLQVELKKTDITITNTNNNTNENNNYVSVTFESVRDKVNNMTSLPDEDIEEIQKLIGEIEEIVNSKETKSKKWSKAKEIIKWIADKGVDVGIALLPLILKIA